MRLRHSGLLLAALLLGSTGSPSTVVALSEAALVDRADVIVRGMVLSIESAARRTGFPVFRDVTLDVVEVLKGDPSVETLHVSLPGGTRDGQILHVPGVPSFHPGEEVVLFLTRLVSGELAVLGLRQGKYRLEPDPSTGFPVVHRDLSHLQVMTPSRPGVTAAQALSARAPDADSWSAFRQRIRERVAQGGRR